MYLNPPPRKHVPTASTAAHHLPSLPLPLTSPPSLTHFGFGLNFLSSPYTEFALTSAINPALSRILPLNLAISAEISVPSLGIEAMISVAVGGGTNSIRQ